MGMKKVKIALGLVCEFVAITTLCLFFGLGIGNLSAQPVADHLLQNQIEISEESNYAKENNGGSLSLDTMRDNTKALSEIEVSLTSGAIMKIFFIAIVLTGISSIIAILFIAKYEPMKILTERN